MALLDFETALGRLVRSPEAEPDLRGLDCAEIAAFERLRRSAGFRFMAGVRRHSLYPCCLRVSVASCLRSGWMPAEELLRSSVRRPKVCWNSLRADCRILRMNYPPADSSRQRCAPTRKRFALPRLRWISFRIVRRRCAGGASVEWPYFMANPRRLSKRWPEAVRVRPYPTTKRPQFCSRRDWIGYAVWRRSGKPSCGKN